jgi:tetratricopeptide (TPR) repeat protein
MKRFLLSLCLLTYAVPLCGQTVDRVIPTKEYYFSLALFNDGACNKALAGFTQELQRAVKLPDANGNVILWLDSMTYWVMCGECHYQESRYDEALRAYNTALQIYLQQPEWLKRISFQGSPKAVPRPVYPWRQSNRKGGAGDFKPCRFQILQENMMPVNLGSGGNAMMAQRQLTVIHADEIISKLALMIRRRAEILGPLSKYDPKTKELVEVLGARPCLPNHFTGVWVDVLYGLALSAMGDDTGAAPALDKGLLMQGTFDHHLTATALYELGNIASRSKKHKEAGVFYLEATLAAQWFGDAALLGECFRRAADTQKLIDKSKPCLPLLAAKNHYNSQKTSPLMMVPLLHEVAEDAFNAGDLKSAETLTKQAANLLRGRDIANSVFGARNFYLNAMISYAQGFAEFSKGKDFIRYVQAGDKNLESALGTVRRASLWLYQLGILETYFQQGLITTKGPITIRIADELYDLMLREPTATDWATQPMDSLAAMTFIPPSAYERWFSIAVQRGDKERAFNISEKARQAKFFSSFGLGPRLFSLRVLFEGADKDISPEMQLERQTLSLDFTKFKELSDKVRAVKKNLKSISVVPTEPEYIEKQKELLDQLEKYSLAQEALLRPIALTRTRVPTAFPPVLTLEQIRKELPEKTSMLVFFQSLGNTYGFLINNKNLEVWQITAGVKEHSTSDLIIEFLESLGNRDGNRALTLKELTDAKTSWKEAGNKLLLRLLGKVRQGNFSELVVVPTGILWYVPFEAMCVGKDEKDFRPLIAAGKAPITVRYAPMASLGIPPKSGGRSATAKTLILHGKMYSSDSTEVALNAVDRYSKAGIKNLVPMPAFKNDPKYRDLPGTASCLASVIQQLVVLDDIPQPSNGLPLAWSPFGNDRAKMTQPISTWLNLPWGGPQLVVLPAFHTPAESALKASNRSKTTVIPNGDDLFLTAMALEACGAKTILISRWRTGGRASLDLTENFLKNLDKLPASEAWRQSILDVAVNPLQLDEEPRLRTVAADKAPIANHPFFWGAFMLLDRGEKAAVEEEEKESALD